MCIYVHRYIYIMYLHIYKICIKLGVAERFVNTICVCLRVCIYIYIYICWARHDATT